MQPDPRRAPRVNPNARRSATITISQARMTVAGATARPHSKTLEFLVNNNTFNNNFKNNNNN